jgi:hypothetical protein
MSEAQRAVTPRPFDLDLEPLVALLRGDINLNVHCYETQGRPPPKTHTHPRSCRADTCVCRVLCAVRVVRCGAVPHAQTLR